MVLTSENEFVHALYISISIAVPLQSSRFIYCQSKLSRQFCRRVLEASLKINFSYSSGGGWVICRDDPHRRAFALADSYDNCQSIAFELGDYLCQTRKGYVPFLPGFGGFLDSIDIRFLHFYLVYNMRFHGEHCAYQPACLIALTLSRPE